MTSGDPYTQSEPENELNLLLDICHLLESEVNLEETLNPIFMIVADHFEIEDGAITIYDAAKEEIYIDSSCGLSVEEQMLGQYKTGEGIIGQVVQTKKVMIIPDLSLETRFLGKTKKRGRNIANLSFICVPILYQQKILGTISITPPKQNLHQLVRIANKLKILSFLIAPSLVLRLAKKNVMQQSSFLIDEESQLRLNKILGNSGTIKDFKLEIHQTSKDDAPTLVLGEEGSGKTFFSYAIHYASDRKSLQPQSYYGYKLEQHDEEALLAEFISLLRQARNSTLVIEEISLLPEFIQRQITDIIINEEVSFQNSVEKVSVRFLFTSTKPLLSLKKHALMYKPLFEILKKKVIIVPPLRKRKNDILIFVNHFLQEENKKALKKIKRIATPAINLLTSYHWPGNISELQQVIHYAYRSCEGGVIHAHLLPPSLQSPESSDTKERHGFLETIAQVESDLIIDALKSTKGNIKKASTFLQLTERQLGLRINKYEINTSEYK